MTRVIAGIAVALALLSTPAAGAARLALWPWPQQASFQGSTLALSAPPALHVAGHSSETLSSALDRYKAILAKPPLVPPGIDAGQRNRADGSVSALSIDVKTGNETLGLGTDESYALKVVAPTATLVAQTVYGALRGLEAFSQLAYRDGAGAFVQAATVEDAPRFSHRGIMIDTSRHFLPLPAIYEMLDAMAYSKFNVLHWHLVDDQSFPYVSTAFPALSGKGAYNNVTHVYSPKDVQGVIAFARSRGIRVIPEFDTPGHTHSWGPAVPGLLTQCYDKQGNPSGYGPIDPTVDANYAFLSSFFGEVASVFADHYVHLGGDEVPFDCWESNPGIQKWMQARNQTDYAELEQYYESRLLALVNKTGSGYVVWQEIFDNGIQVRPDTVIHVWKGGWQPEMQAVTQAGLRAILSTPWYLNYIGYGEDWDKYYAVEPLAFNGTRAQEQLVMGGEACAWAEFIDATNIVSRMFPRAAAVSERLWSPRDVANSTEATPRLHAHRCRLITRGINAEPGSGPGYCPEEFVPAYAPPSLSRAA